jgi:hypothetical protein
MGVENSETSENAYLIDIEWFHVREMLRRIDAEPLEPATEPFVTVNVETLRKGT